jgi:hypothetical protein
VAAGDHFVEERAAPGGQDDGVTPGQALGGEGATDSRRRADDEDAPQAPSAQLDGVLALLALLALPAWPRRTGLVTLPARIHEVHTCSRFGAPLTSARTRWMLGSHRRLVRRWE